MNYTYILKCKDGSFYTGWTNNLEKRIKDHNAGKGAKYTKSRCPVELVYYETFDTKEEAAEAISIERKKIVGDFVRAPFDILNGTRRY